MCETCPMGIFPNKINTFSLKSPEFNREMMSNEVQLLRGVNYKNPNSGRKSTVCERIRGHKGDLHETICRKPKQRGAASPLPPGRAEDNL